MENIILNDDMTLTININLWGAEVDLIAQSITGNKQIITEDTATCFFRGVFEACIMANVSADNKRDVAIFELKRHGKSDEYIQSYLKGWDSVDKIDLTTIGEDK